MARMTTDTHQHYIPGTHKAGNCVWRSQVRQRDPVGNFGTTKCRLPSFVILLASLLGFGPVWALSADSIRIVAKIDQGTESPTMQLHVGDLVVQPVTHDTDTRIHVQSRSGRTTLCLEEDDKATWLYLGAERSSDTSTIPTSGGRRPSTSLSCKYAPNDDRSILMIVTVVVEGATKETIDRRVTFRVVRSDTATWLPESAPFEQSTETGERSLTLKATLRLHPFDWLEQGINVIRLVPESQQGSVQEIVIDFRMMAGSALSEWSKAATERLSRMREKYWAGPRDANEYLEDAKEYLSDAEKYSGLLSSDDGSVSTILDVQPIERERNEIVAFNEARLAEPEPLINATTAELKDAVSKYSSYMSQFPDGRGSKEASARIRKLSEEASWKCLSAPGKTYRGCDECPVMAVIPAGGFEMGSPWDESGRFPNERQYSVTIPDADGTGDGKTVLSVGIHEVRQSEYAAVLPDTESPSTDDGCWTYEWDSYWKWMERLDRNWSEPGYTVQDDYPVVCVNWHEATTYTMLLNDRTDGGGFRLLSEAEWEYVARAGTTKAFHFRGGSDNLRAGDAHFNFGLSVNKDTKNHDRDEKEQVGVLVRPRLSDSFKQNSFGLYHVHGNVWEWVQDCWRENYSDHGYETGSCDLRVVRGGSWADDEERYLRSAMRGRNDDELRTSFTGFRIAQDLTRDWVVKNSDWSAISGDECRL